MFKIDWDRYNELTDKEYNGEELTEEEKDFCKYMYHYEEWQAGLL